jgi:cobalt-zinc-cadmium efflux system protein
MNTDHAHQHGHPHTHNHVGSRDGRSRKLLFAFVLTIVMMVAEVIGGAWSGSLALLADAGHMMVDALALLLAVVGAWMATRPADARRSYGYGRMEVLVGFVNALS